MPANHIVKSGDCISSIAGNSGFFPDTIWNHPANAELKNTRHNPNTLAEGDVVVIPDKQERTESCTIDQEHRFRKRGVPALFRLRVLDEGRPVANVRYTATLEGIESGDWAPISATESGATDTQGLIVFPIPPNVRTGRLVIESAPEPLEYELEFGTLPPVETVAGAQTRLNNLGFDCGAADGVLNQATTAALRAFQVLKKLEPSGALDAPTTQALRKQHDGT